MGEGVFVGCQAGMKKRKKKKQQAKSAQTHSETNGLLSFYSKINFKQQPLICSQSTNKQKKNERIKTYNLKECSTGK